MNTQTQEALKMAIEALEWSLGCIDVSDWEDDVNMSAACGKYAWAHQALEACKEALKPHPDCDEACMFQCQMERKFSQEQEPVKQRVKVLYEKDGIQTCEILHDTHPAQPLSDDDILHIANGQLDCVDEEYIKRFARAIEKAHGIGE